MEKSAARGLRASASDFRHSLRIREKGEREEKWLPSQRIPVIPACRNASQKTLFCGSGLENPTRRPAPGGVPPHDTLTSPFSILLRRGNLGSRQFAEQVLFLPLAISPLELAGCRELLLCFCSKPRLEVGLAQLDVKVGAVRLDRDRSLEIGNRLPGISLPHADLAEPAQR